MRSRIWSVVVVVVVSAVVILGGCADRLTGGGDSPRADGPLAPLAAGGFVAVHAPARTPYIFTIGAFRLCRDGDGDGDPLVLDSVNFDVKSVPLKIYPVVRTIPPEDEMRGHLFHYSPIGSLLGRPGHFRGSKVKGTFSSDLSGTVVEPACDEHDDPSKGKLELLIVTKVPRGGSDVRGFTINYHVGDDHYFVKVPWRMIGCGDRVAKDLCGS